MIRYHSSKQLTILEFDGPFQVALNVHNRWVKLSQCIPWDELAEGATRVFPIHKAVQVKMPGY